MSQARSYSRGSGSRSQTLNYNLQEKKRLKPEEIQSLEQGRFVGKTVGAHHPTFDNRVHLLERYSGTPTHYPIEDFAHNVELEKNYINILHEVKQILEEFE